MIVAMRAGAFILSGGSWRGVLVSPAVEAAGMDMRKIFKDCPDNDYGMDYP